MSMISHEISWWDSSLFRTSGKVILTVKLAGLWYEEMIQEIKVCITVNSSETSASVSRLSSYWKLKWNCKFHVIRLNVLNNIHFKVNVLSDFCNFAFLSIFDNAKRWLSDITYCVILSFKGKCNKIGHRIWSNYHGAMSDAHRLLFVRSTFSTVIDRVQITFHTLHCMNCSLNWAQIRLLSKDDLILLIFQPNLQIFFLLE